MSLLVFNRPIKWLQRKSTLSKWSKSPLIFDHVWPAIPALGNELFSLLEAIFNCDSSDMWSYELLLTTPTSSKSVPWSYDCRSSGDECAINPHAFIWTLSIASSWHRWMDAKSFVDYAIQKRQRLQCPKIIDVYDVNLWPKPGLVIGVEGELIKDEYQCRGNSIADLKCKRHRTKGVSTYLPAIMIVTASPLSHSLSCNNVPAFRDALISQCETSGLSTFILIPQL